MPLVLSDATAVLPLAVRDGFSRIDPPQSRPYSPFGLGVTVLPAVRAEDEEAEEEEDVPDSDIIPPTEPLETTSDFDEDDFDDDFDDDFEEELDEDEFGSEGAPESFGEDDEDDPFDDED
jgi:hypothetical protein